MMGADHQFLHPSKQHLPDAWLILYPDSGTARTFSFLNSSVPKRPCTLLRMPQLETEAAAVSATAANSSTGADDGITR